jgi:hypothetical protein
MMSQLFGVELSSCVVDREVERQARGRGEIFVKPAKPLSLVSGQGQVCICQVAVALSEF